MKRMEETELFTFNTLIPKAKFCSTNCHNTVELEKQQPLPRPSSTAHSKVSYRIVSDAASARRSSEMQTKHRILLPFIHQQGFLLICKVRFQEPNLFVLNTSVSIKIAGTIIAIHPTHKSCITESSLTSNSTGYSGHLQAYFKTQH